MPNIFLPKDITETFFNISKELKRMNDLKEKELELKYGSDNG